jgi:hypothetical protein
MWKSICSARRLTLHWTAPPGDTNWISPAGRGPGGSPGHIPDDPQQPGVHPHVSWGWTPATQGFKPVRSDQIPVFHFSFFARFLKNQMPQMSKGCTIVTIYKLSCSPHWKVNKSSPVFILPCQHLAVGHLAPSSWSHVEKLWSTSHACDVDQSFSTQV